MKQLVSVSLEPVLKRQPSLNFHLFERVQYGLHYAVQVLLFECWGCGIFSPSVKCTVKQGTIFVGLHELLSSVFLVAHKCVGINMS